MIFSKLIGALCIIGATSLYGYSLTKDLDNRLNSLNQLKRAFLLLRSEIRFSLETLPDAFIKVAMRMNDNEDNVRLFFENVANRLREDKEMSFDAIDTVKGCLALFTGMIATMKFNNDVMEASAKNGFTNATDAADYLVNHGVPFRDAHGIIGQLVLLCIEKDISLDELPLEDYKKISPVFEEDIYEAIRMQTCVERRNTIGAPGLTAMQEVLSVYKDYLTNEAK